MKSFFQALVLLVPFSALVLAEETPTMDRPTPAPAPASDEIPIPDPPELAAKGYLLVEHNSGSVLAESNAGERLEPASLTKIMTAYVVFRELAGGNLTLEDQVLISEKAWRTGGSKMFIEVGKKVSLEDLLKGMIVQSGNDASVALAEHIAGSEETFAELDEHPCQAPGNEGQPLCECHRPAPRGSLHHGTGYGPGHRGQHP